MAWKSWIAAQADLVESSGRSGGEGGGCGPASALGREDPVADLGGALVLIDVEHRHGPEEAVVLIVGDGPGGEVVGLFVLGSTPGGQVGSGIGVPQLRFGIVEQRTKTEVVARSELTQVDGR